MLTINFVANFGNGYVGEVGDANHLVREMEALGHKVIKVPQDIWKASSDGEIAGGDWVLPEKADINIICKWHHFGKRDYIDNLKARSGGAPVFYWVWDYMWDQGIPEWHKKMVEASSLYLGNDVRNPFYKLHPNSYYFPFDVADADIVSQLSNKLYDVSFFGSWIGQGDRQVWLKEINKTNPITVFSWNHLDWPKEFENVAPAVYGEDFAREIAQSKIILGFSVEPNAWGYWSNRVGKVLSQGGFLLQQYAPGMELFLKDGVEYFSTIEEAREKIDHYLIAETERVEIANLGLMIGRMNFTSKQRVKELMILVERYLKTNGEGWQL